MINHLFALKWFQILLSNINSFICTLFNGFQHHYVTLTIQFKHTVKEFQVLLINTNNSTQHYCDGKLTKIPKRDFIFARVKTGQVGT